MEYKLFTKKDLDKGNAQIKPGNFILTHGNSLIDKFIHFATRSRWNHAALVVSSDGDIIELETKGIQKSTINEYPPDEFYLVALKMEDADRKQVVAYAEYMLKKHAHYGILTVVSILLKILTNSRLVIKLDGTLICSEFVAKALAQGGIIWDRDTSLIVPADLYRKFTKM
jgi:hypothetical protein